VRRGTVVNIGKLVQRCGRHMQFQIPKERILRWNRLAIKRVKTGFALCGPPTPNACGEVIMNLIDVTP